MGELLMVAGALRNFQHLTSWYGSSEHDALPTDDLFYALAPEPGLEQQISSAILAPDAMADTASRTLEDLRKKDPRHRKQHPRPAGKHGAQYGHLQISAGECGIHAQWPVCCAGQERIPRRGERHHPRRILYRSHGVCGAAGRCGSKCPHFAVPRTGSPGDRAHFGGLYRTGGRH